jgi:hypothetical protein
MAKAMIKRMAEKRMAEKREVQTEPLRPQAGESSEIDLHLIPRAPPGHADGTDPCGTYGGPRRYDHLPGGAAACPSGGTLGTGWVHTVSSDFT